MSMIQSVSNAVIPIIILVIILAGIIKKVPVYEEFIEGAKDGLKVVVGILPTLIGLMAAVGVFRASGALEFVTGLLRPVSDCFLVPSELLSLLVIKLFSSSAATGFLLDIYKNHGPDSYMGTAASILCASTETLFYTCSVYFMATSMKGIPGVKKTRYTIAGALIAILAGAAASFWLAA